MKLHPLSIPYRAVRRGGGIFVITLFASGEFNTGGGSNPLSSIFPSGTQVTVGTILALIVVAIFGAWSYLYYLRFEYELTNNTFDIHKGVISRQSREIPFKRIQNVDVRRNIVQRIIGIAEVRLETAGGGSTEGVLKYVGYEESRNLQREIRRKKRELEGDEKEEKETEEGPARQEQKSMLFELMPRELFLLSAFSIDVRVLGLIGFISPVIPQLVPEDFDLGIGAGWILVVLGFFLFGLIIWIGGAVSQFLRYYDFKLLRTRDSLEYERGLLNRFSGSIPLNKIQTLVLRENVLMRKFGYLALKVETAGYAGQQSSQRGSEAAIPLAERERCLEIAKSIEEFGEPDIERPPKRSRRRYTMRYSIGVSLLALTTGLYRYSNGIEGFSLPLPWYTPLGLLILVPFAAHYKWKHRGYYLGDDYIVTRNGFWNRETSIVPYYRVQNVIHTQTIFQRRWRIGSVVVDTAGSEGIGGGGSKAIDIDNEVAEKMREEINNRLQKDLKQRRIKAWRKRKERESEEEGTKEDHEEKRKTVGEDKEAKVDEEKRKDKREKKEEKRKDTETEENEKRDIEGSDEAEGEREEEIQEGPNQSEKAENTEGDSEDEVENDEYQEEENKGDEENGSGTNGR